MGCYALVVSAVVKWSHFLDSSITSAQAAYHQLGPIVASERYEFDRYGHELIVGSGNQATLRLFCAAGESKILREQMLHKRKHTSSACQALRPNAK